MYRRLGERWMWFSRLVKPRAEVAAILGDANVETYMVRREGEDQGLLELDFRVAGEAELAFFGLDEAVVGKGAGRWLMNRALALAWAKPIGRFWVHTCTLDHPSAPEFYQRSGFRCSSAASRSMTIRGSRADAPGLRAASSGDRVGGGGEMATGSAFDPLRTS